MLLSFKNIKNLFIQISKKNSEFIVFFILFFLMIILLGYSTFNLFNSEFIYSIFLMLLGVVTFPKFFSDSGCINIKNGNLKFKSLILTSTLKATIIVILFNLFLILVFGDSKIDMDLFIKSWIISVFLLSVDRIIIYFSIGYNDLFKKIFFGIINVLPIFLFGKSLLLIIVIMSAILILILIEANRALINKYKLLFKAPYNIDVLILFIITTLIVLVMFFELFNMQFMYVGMIYLLFGFNTLFNSLHHHQKRINSINNFRISILLNSCVWVLIIITFSLFFEINFSDFLLYILLFLLLNFVYKELSVSLLIKALICMALMFSISSLTSYDFPPNALILINIFLLLNVLEFTNKTIFKLYLKVIIISAIISIAPFISLKIAFIYMNIMFLHELIHIYYFEKFIGKLKYESLGMFFSLQFPKLDNLTSKQSGYFYITPTIFTMLLAIIALFFSEMLFMLLILQVVNLLPIKGTDYFKYKESKKL